MDLNPDWRSQLSPESRLRIVNKIRETLSRHLPVPVPDGLSEINKIATRFEEKIYNSATSQPDYLRKISLKMISMETKTIDGASPSFQSPNSSVKPKECKICGNCSHKRRNAN